MRLSERWRNFCVALPTSGGEPINVQEALMPLHHIRKSDGAACFTPSDEVGIASSWRYPTPLELRVYLRKHGNFRCNLELHTRTTADHEAITFSLTVERFIWAEMMTHRVSRQASSSRAIPFKRMQKWIERDPAMPLHFGANQPGMQSGGEIDDVDGAEAFLLDRLAGDFGASNVLHNKYDLHKEVVNRYEEPYGWINGVFTFTRPSLHNLFHLRLTRYAHPNIQRVVLKMARLYQSSQPIALCADEWHIPFVKDKWDWNWGPPSINRCKQFQSNTVGDGLLTGDLGTLLVWSVARSAWCSYKTVEDKDATYADALKRHDDCVNLAHATPLEHQNRATGDDRRSGTMIGFEQYRHMIPGESCSEFDFSRLAEYEGYDFILPNDAHFQSGTIALLEQQKRQFAREMAELARQNTCKEA